MSVFVTGRKCACCSIGEWIDELEDDEERLYRPQARDGWPVLSMLCSHCDLAACKPGDAGHVDDPDGCGLCSLLWVMAMKRWSEIAQ